MNGQAERAAAKGYRSAVRPSLPSPGIDRPRILIVCTANQCRSPMAEGLLRHRLAERGIVASVDSAGLLPGGVPATPFAVEVLAERGIDLAPHRSRALTDTEVDLADADLVITMERRHLQEAVVFVPEIRSRAFTLVDVVRRAEADGGARRPSEDLRTWGARLAAGRSTSELLGIGDDSVDDPIGEARSRYDDTAVLLDDLLTRLVTRAWPPDDPFWRQTFAGARKESPPEREGSRA